MVTIRYVGLNIDDWKLGKSLQMKDDVSTREQKPSTREDELVATVFNNLAIRLDSAGVCMFNKGVNHDAAVVAMRLKGYNLIRKLDVAWGDDANVVTISLTSNKGTTFVIHSARDSLQLSIMEYLVEKHEFYGGVKGGSWF